MSNKYSNRIIQFLLSSEWSVTVYFAAVTLAVLPLFFYDIQANSIQSESPIAFTASGIGDTSALEFRIVEYSGLFERNDSYEITVPKILPDMPGVVETDELSNGGVNTVEGEGLQGLTTALESEAFLYADSVAKKILSQRVYPRVSRRLGEEGVASVEIIILSNGEINGLTVCQSSGYTRLDENAVETVKSSAPFATFEGEGSRTVIIDLIYRLFEP